MLDSVGELAAIEDLNQMGRDAYRDAWAWVHYMLHGPREARDELIRNGLSSRRRSRSSRHSASVPETALPEVRCTLAQNFCAIETFRFAICQARLLGR